MNIHTLWGLRRDFENGPPELMEAWDEHSIDNWSDGWDEACEKAIASWGDELMMAREVIIEVDERLVMKAFRPAMVDGVVASAETQEPVVLDPEASARAVEILDRRTPGWDAPSAEDQS